ncbi:hypothetical protein NA57DRAFT_55751 [Rhizodiscina lignyota]|uniref:Uncharacterized protein n=1 Tax=Rhizodiscina lignyota TaxID=1504668 RepID=A0A9P4IIB7_9PEZI|nr:hypothetical protein NA57DRAFT_55751 [Rhizodiscina lignyota]
MAGYLNPRNLVATLATVGVGYLFRFFTEQAPESSDEIIPTTTIVYDWAPTPTYTPAPVTSMVYVTIVPTASSCTYFPDEPLETPIYEEANTPVTVNPRVDSAFNSVLLQLFPIDQWVQQYSSHNLAALFTSVLFWLLNARTLFRSLLALLCRLLTRTPKLSAMQQRLRYERLSRQARADNTTQRDMERGWELAYKLSVRFHQTSMEIFHARSDLATADAMHAAALSDLGAFTNPKLLRATDACAVMLQHSSRQTASLQSQLAAKTERAVSLTAQVAQHWREIDELNKANKGLTRSLEYAEGDIATLRSSAQKRRAAYKARADELAQLAREKADLEMQRDDARRALSLADTKLDMTERSLAAVYRQMEDKDRLGAHVTEGLIAARWTAKRTLEKRTAELRKAREQVNALAHAREFLMEKVERLEGRA